MKQAVKILLLTLSVWLFCCPLTWSQVKDSDVNSKDKNLLGVESNAKSSSLLDPQRLKISQSYSFSYFSNSNSSGSFGTYTTTLRYQLSDPLSLTLSLNYLHQPLSVFGRDDLRVKNSILPNFQLHYKPCNSFSLWINVLTFFSPYSWGNDYHWWEQER
jgi:hypothetical protein